MRITEVVIDGFKSYAVRTVISDWDESFNSITGLNGSGKSNILDAICFVLGITNMSTVRAQNLQDLIYKRGQAGVTKASVTIVFDNRDTKRSPVGFEEYAQISVTRQIVLGGTSKYLINGHRAQQQTVQNLFQSVQLNINNPNFLIMQGRITKVLNMKPVEVLSMIEETAGTRMFEDRRDKASKTMAKKEMKVDEIKELLKDEIEPKLEKLRTEKRAFLDFQQTQSDLERLTRVVVSHDYAKNQERVSQSASDLEAKQLRSQEIEDSATRMRREIQNLTEDIAGVKRQRDKELRKGGNFQKLEEEAKSHSHNHIRLSTILDLKASGLKEDRKRRDEIIRDTEKLESLVKEKGVSYEELKERHDTAKQALDPKVEEVEKKEELLQTLQTGVASREGQDSGYQGQIQDARNRVQSALTEQEQAKLKVTHLQGRIAEDAPRAAKAKIDNSSLTKNLDRLKSQAEKLEADLRRLGIEVGREESLKTDEKAKQQTIRDLKGRSDVLRRKVAGIDFSYTDPIPNFDRSKVCGLVAQLFTLDESKSEAATALEVSAGGRLYNVVVKDETVGSQLLQHGKLRKRVTIIPLNKISSFKASAEKLGAAKRLVPGKVDLALSLIGYEQEVSAALEYVFGSTLICHDAETSKKVTFDPAIRMKSVTLEGDVYDPSGTLSGGSAPTSSGILVTLGKLNAISTQLRTEEAALSEIQAVIASEKYKLDQARGITQDLELKQHEITLTEEQINGNSAATVIAGLAEMEATVKSLKNSISESKVRQSEAEGDVRRTEKDMKEFKNNKEDKLKELQTSLGKLKKIVDKAIACNKDLYKATQAARLESEQAQADLEAVREQQQEAQLTIDSQETDLADLTKELTAVKDALEISQARLSDERAKLSGFDEELSAIEETIRQKHNRIAEEGLEQQKLGHEIERFHKDSQAARQTITHLEKEHDWIAEEKNKFGRPGSAYDFRGLKISESKSSLKNLTERFQGMKKKINPKVMNMIDSVEKKEVALKSMLRTVTRDKRKIEETVETLDEYKKEALQKTWEKVNKDFGQIFEMLLPGSFARLDAPEGKTIMDGLEIKVCLGKVWKESLTELSGGQRSLIALSLIMALLQFKPAPMYILDEVDAALDLSHTQNIGRLIKSRFKGSQFIVVSLKEGMFQNANRIFRTRFSEGTSHVQSLTSADMR